MKISQKILAMLLFLQVGTSYAQINDIAFNSAYAYKWEHNGVRYEMLTFFYDIGEKTPSSSGNNPEFPMPITVRMKSVEKNGRINILEFDTKAVFKYTFADHGEDDGYKVTFFPPVKKRLVQGEDHIPDWEYNLYLNKAGQCIRGNVERTKFSENAMLGYVDKEKIAEMSAMLANSTEEQTKMINNFFSTGATPLSEELLLRLQPEEVYIDKKANVIIAHMKRIISTKWPALKGKIIHKNVEDPELNMIAYKAAIQIPGATTSVLETFDTVQKKHISSNTTIEFKKLSDDFIDVLIGRIKQNFKAYTEIDENVPDPEYQRYVTFKKKSAVFFGPTITLFLQKKSNVINISIIPDNYN